MCFSTYIFSFLNVSGRELLRTQQCSRVYQKPLHLAWQPSACSLLPTRALQLRNSVGLLRLFIASLEEKDFAPNTLQMPLLSHATSHTFPFSVCFANALPRRTLTSCPPRLAKLCFVKLILCSCKRLWYSTALRCCQMNLVKLFCSRAIGTPSGPHHQCLKMKT